MDDNLDPGEEALWRAFSEINPIPVIYPPTNDAIADYLRQRATKETMQSAFGQGDNAALAPIIEALTRIIGRQ